jgi:hypothetical protein
MKSIEAVFGLDQHAYKSNTITLSEAIWLPVCNCLQFETNLQYYVAGHAETIALFRPSAVGDRRSSSHLIALARQL